MSYYELIEAFENICFNCDNIFHSFLNSSWFLITIFIVLVLFVFIGLKLYKWSKPKLNCLKKFEMKECQIASVTIQFNNSNAELAYKIYIQLITRKIGLKYESDDILVEVYNSWYQAFGVIRQLLSEVKPVEYNTSLIAVCIKILNNNLRGHLTKYQGDFRKWYEVELNKEENKELSPQKIQSMYSKYEELVNDLIENQNAIIELIEEIESYFSINID